METEIHLQSQTDRPSHEIPLSFVVVDDTRKASEGITWIAVKTPTQNNEDHNLTALPYYFANAIAGFLNANLSEKLSKKFNQQVNFAPHAVPTSPVDGHDCINPDKFHICWMIQPVEWQAKLEEALTEDDFPSFAIADFLNDQNLTCLLAVVKNTRDG
jgi:hypothetical protein